MRRLSTTQKLVPAFEDEGIGQAPVVVEAPADNANSLETDMIEVADHSADIAALQNETDSTVAVMEALGGIAGCLGESAKSGGGLDRHGAQAVGIAVEALYKQVGVKRSAMPALESFGGTQTRPTATKIAMEEIKEQIAKIWAAICAAFEKAIAWIVDFYNKVTDAAAKLQKRGEELAKKAGELKGEAKEKTIKNDRVSAALSTSKGSGDKAALEHTVNVAKDCISGKTGEQAETVSKNVLTAMDKSTGEFIAGFTCPSFVVAGVHHEVDAAGSGYEAAPEGTVCTRTEELLGGRTLLTYGPKEASTGEAAVKAFSHVKYVLAAFDPKKAPEAKELPTLTGADAASIASTVAELGKVLVEAKAHAEKINESKKKMLEKAKSLGKAAANLDEKSDDAKNLKAAQQVCQSYVKNADQPRATVSAYALSVGKAALDYVELSLKAYSEKAEEKKPEGAAAPAATPAAAAA